MGRGEGDPTRVIRSRRGTLITQGDAGASEEMQGNRGPGLAFFLLPRRAMKLIDSRHSALAMSLALALVGGSLSACNDSGVVGAPVAESPTPTPTATPGAPQAPIAIIESGSPIYSTLDDATFDGYFSYDPDGYVVSYAWQVVTAPAGSTSAMVPDAFDGSTSSLYLDLPGTYTIKLTVTDNDGLTGSETYSLDATVSAFHVQLAWPGQYTMADMDLYINENLSVSQSDRERILLNNAMSLFESEL